MKKTIGSEKYDIHFNTLDVNTSHGKILSQISPGSKVLECGCSTGYMTRWMSENLECHVSIVEIDEKCFQIASQYAENGYCGDLQQDGWIQFFQNERFDYVLFADVLEHLIRPLDVLQQAKKILKNEGKVIASIPNIAHNDIILRLSQDQFTYTKLGLLDETHVHFWGRNNLEDFFAEAGFSIVSLDGTRAPTGSTEQFLGDVSSVDFRLLNLLKCRPLGEIYQYVVVLQKEDYCLKHSIIPDDRLPREGEYAPAPTTLEKIGVQTTVFFRDGEEYTQEKSVSFSRLVASNTAEVFSLDVNLPSGCHQIRLDPCEGEMCLVEEVHIQYGCNTLSVADANGTRIMNSWLFTETDPQMRIDIPDNNEIEEEQKIHISFTMRIVSSLQEETACEINQSLLNERMLLNEKEQRLSVVETTIYMKKKDGGFDESDSTTYRQEYYRSERNVVSVHIDLQLPRNCDCVRVDPCELQYCTVSSFVAIYDGKLLTPMLMNGFFIDDVMFFNTEDPQILLQLPDTDGRIMHLDMEIQLFQTRDLTIALIGKAEAAWKAHFEEKEKRLLEESEIKQAAIEREQMQRIAALEDELVEKEREKTESIAALEDKLAAKEQENAERIAALEDKLAAKEQENTERTAALESELAARERENAENAFRWKERYRLSEEKLIKDHQSFVQRLKDENAELTSMVQQLMILSAEKDRLLIKREQA